MEGSPGDIDLVIIRIGLIINPIAGLGGPAGLKGTDGVVQEAINRGAVSHVAERVNLVIGEVNHDAIEWITLPEDMGARLLSKWGIEHRVVGSVSSPTTGDDTRRGVKSLESESVDLLLFAGGDGTARDVIDARASCPAVLGIPSGVKMHSGVFATSPGAAAEIVKKLVAGQMLSVIDAEVRDIDETSFREGIVKTEYYGELPVPDDLRYMQQTKVGGREVEELVVEEIAADFRQQLEPDVLYIMGSGSTIAGILESMGLESTLLGVDALYNGKLILLDGSEKDLLALTEKYDKSKIVVTAIGGQGHILGRGNQQISPAVIHNVGIENILIVASKTKLAALEQRPLLVDTGDPALDDQLKGLRTVITGFEDRVFYRVA